ncbi:hypothetical protein V6Z11_D06G207700 [Gossypium hirsutum]
MENPKTPETLEAKNPDLDLLEEAYEPPDLLTLIESSNGLGSILDVQLQENGNAFGGDSLAMDVKENGVNIIETEEGYLVGDGVDNVKEDQEERLEVRVETGIGDNAVVEPIKDEGTKEDDRSGINGVGLVKNVQVSGDNISLYVDFSSTLNEVNSTGLMMGKEELMVDGQEYKFYVGDIVWIRTKSQSWWPGKIFDPSKVPEYALAGEEKNWLLVGYFGSSRVAWCCSSQLKPFHVNFRQMIGRNKARSFLGAVEKAVEDFGKCLKMEMTCSCILKEDKFLSYGSSTKEGASMPERKSGRLGEFSATQFEPVKFLCQLKSFAQVVSKPDMLEFVALQNYLSAFYCSIGHFQLPLQQLWETTYDADNAGSGSMGERDNNAGLAEGNSISYKFLLEQSDVMKNEMLQHNPNGVTAKVSGENWGALPGSCEDIIAGEGVFSSNQALTSRKRKRKVHYELSNSSTLFEGPDQGTCLSVENGDDDSELRNETGYELRERKKSSKSGQKKRGRKPRAPSSSPNPVLTSNIPDLNGTSTEPNTSTKDSQEANSVPPTGKPARKRRRRRKGKISLGTPSMIIDYNGAGTSGKLLATTLLLTFTPGASMPSKEVLVATFSRFGPLKESEVQILKDSSNAHVVFMRNEDAAKALRSLEESNPFGATLTNFQLQNNNILTTHQHMEGFRLPAKLTGAMPRLGDAPPIDVIKKNLEMMTSMLEKSGDNLSPEMKAKLESEIKGLLKKVSHCPGSSS